MPACFTPPKAPQPLLVPVANYMQQSSGNWDRVFIIAAGANILASLLAIAVLKPWRKIVVANAPGVLASYRTIYALLQQRAHPTG